ncbi:MAG: ABC-type antimicrobial peptide transport system permease subunit, partial [Verrucomicrobiales bacterium]
SPWQLLNDKRPSEPVISDSGSESIQAGFTPVIPGVIDEATATYALKKGLGDLIDYEGSDGRQFHIQLVGFIDNSVLQGSIVISEENFLKFYPAQPGYRFLMIEGDFLAKLAKSLIDSGASKGEARKFLDAAVFVMGSEDRNQEELEFPFSKAIQLGLSGALAKLNGFPESWPDLSSASQTQFEVLRILDAQDWSGFSMSDAEKLVEKAMQGPSGDYADVLTRQLEDRGLALTETWRRLNQFNAVQNTYLSIFSMLGGLGILLGTIGLGVVVSRNILERKGQMGLLEAVGFPKPTLAKLVVSEHWFLHVFGVLSGIAAAVISILPTLSERSTGLPIGALISLNTAILVGGLIFCWLAARWMLRAELIESLRHE